ncbi:MAG: PAS domain-containing protein [Magnetococcales bacterium]|nr:PAS domain-containing protein [Magnetococcales bacterium]
MISRPWLTGLLLLSFAPAILITPSQMPWILWILPLTATFLITRQRQPVAHPQQETIEVPPEFSLARRSHTPREQWQTTVMRWRAAIETLPEGVMILDHQFAISWFNPEAQNLLGLFAKRDLGQSVLYPLGQPVLDDYLRQGDFSRPLDLPSPINGHRMLNIRFIPMENAQSWLVLVRDITTCYQIDRQQSDFLANVSHELKTPLTVFRGMLELLPELTPDSEQWHSALALMQKQTERMQGVIEDQTALLRLGSRQEYPVCPIDMRTFLKELVEEAKALSGARCHEFVLSVDTEFAFAGNRELLRCVASNLLFNAVHHTPPQSEVRVVWQKDHLNQPTLIVSDNGPGIAAYHLPRLTEKHYRVTFQQSVAADHLPHQGTGLGLALVKQTMDRCRGQLEIASQPGIGSRFACRFPSTSLIRQPDHES